MAKTERLRVSAIIVKTGKIILINRKNQGKEYWVLPGGGIEDSDLSEEDAIKREVKEETNLNVVRSKLAFKVNHSDDSEEKHPCFVCEVDDGELEFIGLEMKLEPDVNWYQPEWVDVKQVESLLLYPTKTKEKLLKLLKIW